jgi:hypothetical protein
VAAAVYLWRSVTQQWSTGLANERECNKKPLRQKLVRQLYRRPRRQRCVSPSFVREYVQDT